MGEIFAVLTGDLVRSSRLSGRQLDQARASLHAAADEVKRWKRGLVRGAPEFFRGDAWQMLLTEPKWALRVAVFVRASLLGGELGDTRVVIGIGTVDRVNPKRISLSTGQAFTLAGEGLDALTQYFRMSIELPEAASGLATWVSCGGPTLRHGDGALDKTASPDHSYGPCTGQSDSSRDSGATRPSSQQASSYKIDGWCRLAGIAFSTEAV